MRQSLWLLAALLSALPISAFQATNLDLAQQARAELYACRYERAVELYRQALAQKPSGDTYYGLTRALLRTHRPKEAYSVAEEGLQRGPHSAASETAAGLAMFRKGELSQSENHFRAALRLDEKDCRALSGMATIYNSVSMLKSARDLIRQAYLACPDDPELMLARANTLRGAEHIAALEQAAAAIDPESEEARNLRSHIASDRAIAERKLRRLVSAYEPTRIKFVEIMHTSTRSRGFGLKVQFNGRQTATLLLDTGASGISVAPKIAQKAGLELLSDESSEAKGIGDKKPEDSFSYLASEVRIGSVAFADHPVRVFRAAKDSDIDGLIGADVFQRFIVSLDFPSLQMELEPYQSTNDDEPQDAGALAAGFHRAVRAGTHLLIATSVNESKAKFFLIDSGSFSNLIDSEAAREFTDVRGDGLTSVRGVQGKVDRVSRADRVTLAFAGFRQDNPNLIAINLENPSESMGIGITGVLGMPVLRQLKLTIDYRAAAVRFARP